MRVRVFVRPTNRAFVKELVHATIFEPVHIDAEKGILVFEVLYGQVENVLNRLAKTDICDFLAHVGKIPK